METLTGEIWTTSSSSVRVRTDNIAKAVVYAHRGRNGGKESPEAVRPSTNLPYRKPRPGGNWVNAFDTSEKQGNETKR